MRIFTLHFRFLRFWPVVFRGKGKPLNCESVCERSENNVFACAVWFPRI